MLLLDEATSALDRRAGGEIQKALNKASEGRTTIIIAHKLATIRKADDIVVMNKRRMVEQGTHEVLIVHDGIYAQLMRVQDLNDSIHIKEQLYIHPLWGHLYRTQMTVKRADIFMKANQSFYFLVDQFEDNGLY